MSGNRSIYMIDIFASDVTSCPSIVTDRVIPEDRKTYWCRRHDLRRLILVFEKDTERAQTIRMLPQCRSVIFRTANASVAAKKTGGRNLQDSIAFQAALWGLAGSTTDPRHLLARSRSRPQFSTPSIPHGYTRQPPAPPLLIAIDESRSK